MVWFESGLGCHGYEAMAALGGREVPSVGGREHGVRVSPCMRTGLNSADAGPTAALEMVRDWIICKQRRNPHILHANKQTQRPGHGVSST